MNLDILASILDALTQVTPSLPATPWVLVASAVLTGLSVGLHKYLQARKAAKVETK